VLFAFFSSLLDSSKRKTMEPPMDKRPPTGRAAPFLVEQFVGRITRGAQQIFTANRTQHWHRRSPETEGLLWFVEY
jgi:hypothetical protein